MTAADFILKYLPEQAVKDFELLPAEDRLVVLERLGNPCTTCGALDERWCCYDPVEA